MVGPWIGVVFGLSALGFGIRFLLRTLRTRREHRHLDEEGLVAHGKVATVEPMRRKLNNAAGQPVTVSYQDNTNAQRYGRDETGLGGYLAREGTLAVIRYSPTHPDLARVEQLVGWHGPYPVRPDGGPPGRSLAGPVFMLAAGVLFVAAFGAMTFGDPDRVEATIDDVFLPVLPLLFVVVGIGLLAGVVVSGLRRSRRTGAPQEETTGVVTDVWRKRVGSSKNQRWVYPFTVHFAARDGREVHSRHPAASSNFRPRPQQQVRVRYDPTHPVRFNVREVGGTALAVVIPVIIGIVFVLIGSFVSVIMFAT